MEVQPLTADLWPLFQSSDGKVLDEYTIRKFVFLKGASKDVRPQLWQYLLGYWSPSSTSAERRSADARKKKRYEDLMLVVRTTSSPPDDWKIIEKDVARTDRHLECFKESDSPLMLRLTRILRAFSIHNSAIGYVQGMSDILTPLLLVLDEEHVIFWCFCNLIERRKEIFGDLTLSVPLNAVRQLCWYVDRTVHDYIVHSCGDEQWLFCYRMVLLDFKREFLDLEDVISLWERMWACHRSQHFPILFAVAVLVNYRSRIFSCSSSEDLMEMSSSLVRKMPFAQLFSVAKIIMEQMKADEYCPYNIRYLISGDSYAPPPMVGFVRVRQRFSSHSSTAQLQNTWESIFGPSSSTPLILAPTEIDRDFSPTQPTPPVASTAISNKPAPKKLPVQAPPKQGFVPKKIEQVRGFGQHRPNDGTKIRLLETKEPSGSNPDTNSLSISFMGNKGDLSDDGTSACLLDLNDFDSLRSEPQLEFMA